MRKRVVAPRKSCSARYIHILAICLFLIATKLTAGPQVISSETSLRVAFVFSIAKFLNWPEANFSGPITLCAVNSLPETQLALNQLSNKSLQGTPIKVVFLTATQVHANQLEGCRLLYQEPSSSLVFSSQLLPGSVFIRDKTSTSNIPPTISLWLGEDGHLSFSVDRDRLAPVANY
jgi:hypothetical protein